MIPFKEHSELNEKILIDLLRRHDDPLEFAHAAVQAQKAGQFTKKSSKKLIAQGAAGHRELIKRWYDYHKKPTVLKQNPTILKQSVYEDENSIQKMHQDIEAKRTKSLKKGDEERGGGGVFSNAPELATHLQRVASKKAEIVQGAATARARVQRAMKHTQHQNISPEDIRAAKRTLRKHRKGESEPTFWSEPSVSPEQERSARYTLIADRERGKIRKRREEKRGKTTSIVTYPDQPSLFPKHGR